MLPDIIEKATNIGIKTISLPSRFDNLAEEAIELAHASLKMSRILRSESPTPISELEARKKIEEELSDVCLSAHFCHFLEDDKWTNGWTDQKAIRFIERVKGDHEK